MEMIEETVAGAGGVSIFTRRALVESPRGGAVLLHGYGEHCGRYGQVVELLAGLGLCCYLYDQRGHGRSGGPRGYIAAWDEYLDDLDRFLELVRGWQGAEPVLLLGHSMGGLVAASYLLARRRRAGLLVLSSPLFALAVEVGGAKLALARLASRLWPRLSLPSEVRPEMLSRDPETVAAYAADPLVHRVGNARWLTEMNQARTMCLQKAPELQADGVLVMYGADDPLVAPAGSERFFAGLTVPDRSLVAYPDMLHETFNEIDRQKPLGDLRRWLEERLGGHGA